MSPAYLTPLHTPKFFFFADDIVLYHSNKSASKAANHLSRSLQNLNFTLNKTLRMSLSTNKCASLIFTYRPFNLDNSVILLDGAPIPFVTEYKYLGILLDSRLTWGPHIKKLQATAFSALNIIKLLSSVHWGSDPTVLSLFYKSFIRSKIDYGSTLYANAAHAHLVRLDRVQHQALWWILGACKTTPIADLHAETKIPPLNIRRIYLTNKYVLHSLSLINHHSLKCMSTIYQKWRFASSKIPLLSSVAHSHRKVHKAILKINIYPYNNIIYSDIFRTYPLHKFQLESTP